MNEGQKDILTARGDIQEISEHVISFLDSQGLDVVNASREDDQKMRLSCKNRVKSVFRLFGRRKFHLVECLLERIDEGQIRVSLQYHCYWRYRILLTLISVCLCIAVALQGLYLFSLGTPLPPTKSALYAFALWIAMIPVVGILVLCFVMITFPPPKRVQALCDHLARKTGGKTKVVNIALEGREYFIFFWLHFACYITAILIPLHYAGLAFDDSGLLVGYAFLIFVAVIHFLATRSNKVIQRTALILPLIPISLFFCFWGVIPVPLVDLSKTVYRWAESHSSELGAGYRPAICTAIGSLFLVPISVIIFLVYLLSGQLLRNWVDDIDFQRNHPEFASTEKDKANRPVTLGVLSLYLLLAACQAIGIILAFGVFERSLLGDNYVFRIFFFKDLFGRPEGFLRCFFVAWTFPIVFWTGFLLWKNLQAIIEKIFSGERSFNANTASDKTLPTSLKALTRYANGAQPLLYLDKSPAIRAFTRVPVLPFQKPAITISPRALSALPRDQLLALLAHEMGHIKHAHARLLSALALLSRWTLFGEASLFFLSRHPYRLETQADEFAVRWLEEETEYDRTSLVNLLKSIESERIGRISVHRKPSSFVGIGSDDWLPERLRLQYSKFEDLSMIQKAEFQCRLLDFIIFQGSRADYRHPPLSLRVKHILNFQREDAPMR